jgi:hypothetical protein
VTAAKLADQLLVDDRNSYSTVTTGQSAVNALTIANGAAGNAPEIAATGDDSATAFRKLTRT